jgi:NlpC/P60 family protein
VTPRTACAIPLSLFCIATSASADPVTLAASLIGRPYVWGAEGPREFDCSGLTQYVFREYGVDLPRRAINQSRVGDPADRRLQRGDLVFFSTDAGGSLVTHVGPPKDALLVHGILKVGVVVDDLDQTLTTLKARGVPVFLGPYPARDKVRSNGIIKDNARNLIQFFGK